MRLRVTVTKEDIEEAWQRRCQETGKSYEPTSDIFELASRWHPTTGCPISLALKRELNLKKNPFVDRNVARMLENPRDDFELPAEAIEFQKIYDARGLAAEPFSFFINDGRQDVLSYSIHWSTVHSGYYTVFSKYHTL